MVEIKTAAVVDPHWWKYFCRFPPIEIRAGSTRDRLTTFSFFLKVTAEYKRLTIVLVNVSEIHQKDTPSVYSLDVFE
jgi:hypothetical protein